MPVFELSLDDGRKLHIDADSQEAALAGYQHFKDQETQAAPKAPAATDAPSGVIAGFREGLSHLGNADTAKYFAGADTSGIDKVASTVAPKNYVPAPVYDAKGLHLGNIPQAVAEAAPGITQDMLAGTAAAKLAPGGVKSKALAGIIGAGASTLSRVLGRNAKTDAEIRTGDASAEPAAEDKLRAVAHSVPEAAVSAVLPSRLIPGANRLASVGGKGISDAALKYLNTGATGAAGAAAADAINQVGSTAGTPNGVQYDPARTINAGATGLATGAAMAAPRAAADAHFAVANREFGGENAAATAAAAKRIQDTGEKLGATFGGGRNDFNALQAVKSDVKNELRDAASNVRKATPLSPDADNVLQRAQDGQHLSADDVKTIESATSATPDGANITHLARQARMLQLLQNKGSYDAGEGRWSGGVSGMMDKKLSFITDPTRAIAGTAATAVGLHLLGTASPAFAGAGLGAYGIARAIDGLTGARSPANTFVQHFADMNAQTRLPQTPQAPAAPSAPPPGPAQPWGPVPPLRTGPTGPQVAPPGAAQPAQASPWGPRPPMTGPTGPQVAPPAAPTPQAPQPTISPMALTMLKQKLKAGLPPEPVAPPAPPPVPQVDPTKVVGDAAKSAKDMWAQKAYLAKVQANSTPPEPPAPPPAPAPDPMQGMPEVPTLPKPPATNPVTGLTRNATLLAKALMQDKPQGPASPAEPPAPPVPTGPSKITKLNGKVKTDAPADPFEGVGGYDPLPEDRLHPRDITPEQYAASEVQSHIPNAPRGRKDSYYNSTLDTAKGREGVIESVKADHPEMAAALNGLLRQLYAIGNNKALAFRAINHTAGLMSPAAGASVKARFKDEMNRLWTK